MSDNPYRLTEAELRRSTGHAPGQELVESEPELAVPHDLPLRVTPMSPATEIQALGQLTTSRGPRRRAARVVAVGFLGFLAVSLASSLHVGASTSPDESVKGYCALTQLPHATAADWDAIDTAGRKVFTTIGSIRNTSANRAVFAAGARLSSLASFQGQQLRAAQPFPAAGDLFDAEKARDALAAACAG